MTDACTYPVVLGLVVCGVATFVLSKKQKTSIESEKSEGVEVISLKSFEERHRLPPNAIFNGCIYMDYNATTPVFPEVYQAMIPFLTTCFGNPSSSHIYSKPCKLAVLDARNNVGRLINALVPTDEIFFTSCGTESDNQAINIAIFNYKQKILQSLNCPLPHIITSSIEHPAVLLYLKHLKDSYQIDLTIANVSSEGFVDVNEIRSALNVNTALVTIMHSNNETGTMQPIREVGSVIRQFNRVNNCQVLFHTDAAQSIGKVLLDVQALNVDLLTLVGHKYGASKGVAALYVRKIEENKSGLFTAAGKYKEMYNSPIATVATFFGGGQEGGLRPGTENVPLISGLGAASEIALNEFDELFVHLLTLKRAFLKGLKEAFNDKISLVRFNGPVRSNDVAEILSDLKMVQIMCKTTTTTSGGSGGSGTDSGKSVTPFGTVLTSSSSSTSSTAPPRSSCIPSDMLDQLPNTISVSFKGVKSQNVLHRLNDKVACSAGSACHALPHPTTSDSTSNTTSVTTEEEDAQISHVLQAMKVPPIFAHGTLRLSFGRHTTLKEVELAVVEINKAVREEWKEAGEGC